MQSTITALPNAPHKTSADNLTQDQSSTRDLRDYYREVASDYVAWSRNLNMHFGYWAWGMNPFKREPMLERMSHEVIQRLGLPALAAHVADLGCGAGATARHLARHFLGAHVDAVTCVPEQITQGLALNTEWTGNGHMPAGSVQFHCKDYLATGLTSQQYDGVYAIESDCHCPGAGKQALLSEAARLLKSGGRLVIADAMLRDDKAIPAPVALAYRSMCRNWALSELAECSALKKQLERSGFIDIRFEEIGWNIAPSAFHIPIFATRFTLAALWRSKGRLVAWRWRHILASYCSLLVGLWRPRFGYYLVSARKA
jgi:MPBQ/MSBQ methyltransferase